MAVNTPLIDSLGVSNETQIAEAVSMIRKTGARKVGFIGLAFKPGTDDLRESPILEVIDRLIDEGRDVLAYDSAIRPETRIADQFGYVRNVCPHLEKTVQALPSMLRSSGDALFDECDVVVVTHGTPEIRELVSRRVGAARVVDLVRVFDAIPPAGAYDGIGW